MARIVSLCFCLHIFGLISTAPEADKAPPVIDLIEPSKCGQFGGTKMTITGKNFDSPNPGRNEITLFSDKLEFPCEYQAEGSTSEKLMCYTVPMPLDEYFARVRVQPGEVGENVTTCEESYCTVTVDKMKTPYIKWIKPRSAPPGETLLKIRGLLWTDVYGSNNQLEELRPLRDHMGVHIQFKRGVAGSQECKIQKELLTLDKNLDWGYAYCKVQGNEIGGMRVSLIVSGEYGRTGSYHKGFKRLPSYCPLHVNSLGKIEMYQQYAELLSVSPKEGSMIGGMELTVRGKNFDNSAAHPMTVLIQGVPCNVKPGSFSETQVVCITGAKPASSEYDGYYEGNRGSNVYKLGQPHDAANLENLGDESRYPVSAALDRDWSDGLSHCENASDQFCSIKFGEKAGGMTEAYFVAPFSGTYTFLAKADDFVSLYFSPTGPAKNKMRVAFTTKRTNRGYSIETSQESQQFTLVKGKRYYIQALHLKLGTNGGLDVAFKAYNTPQFTVDQTGDAYMEKQTIKVSSPRRIEKQTVVFNSIPSHSGKSTVQKVTVTTTDAFYTKFRLCIVGLCTQLMKVDERDTNVRSKLEGLPLGLTLTSVTRQDNNGAGIYTITFAAQAGNVPKMTYETDVGKLSATITVSVTMVTEGVMPGNKLILQMGNNPFTEPFSSTALSADTFKDILGGLFKPRCSKGQTTYSSSTMPYWEDFEGYWPQITGGEVTDEEVPFCGSKSWKNPWFLISGVNIRNSKDYSLCFAFKAPSDEIVTLEFNGNPTPLELPVGTGDWQYTCVNIRRMVHASSSYTLTAVLVSRSASAKGDIYVDQVMVSSKVPSAQEISWSRIEPKAKLKRMSVTKTSNNPATFEIEMDPLSSVRNFGLLSLRFGQVKSGTLSSDSVKTDSNGWSSGSVDTTRQSKATGPVTGSFTINVNGTKTTVPFSSSALELEAKIESACSDSVAVKKTLDTGFSSAWEVTWEKPGGNRSTLGIDDTSSLVGDDVSVSVDEVDGHLFVDPIMGDFLRTVHRDSMQVSALVNGLPTKCSGDCSFSYSVSKTPKVTAMKLSANTKNVDSSASCTCGSTGPGCSMGKVLTITGTGFSNDIASNVVRLGDTLCTVTAATDTELKCIVGKASAGTKTVTINVIGKGLASVSETFDYKLCITGISSIEGSTGGGNCKTHSSRPPRKPLCITGGLPVTVSGSGFSETSRITIGRDNCKLIPARTTLTTLVCVPSALGAAKSVTQLTVIDGTRSASCSSCELAFNQDNTPVVNSINPVSSPLAGGGNMTLYGSGLGALFLTTTVNVCEKEVTLIHANDSHVVVVLPPSNQVRCCDVEVLVKNIENKVFRSHSVNQLCYKLRVDHVMPLEGSSGGGTIVTLIGEGFGHDTSKINIKFGEIECAVLSTSHSQTTCITGSTFKVHRVNHWGNHPTFGQGYEWDPRIIEVQKGDFVEWSWVAPIAVKVKYSVQQTATADTEEYDGSGFKSERSSNGSFRHQFVRTGTFYYCSHNLFSHSKLVMRGVVKVIERTDRSLPLNLTLDGMESTYNIKGGSSGVDASSCPGGDYMLSGCSSPKPTGTDATKFNFAYWACKTPYVTSVSPANVTSFDAVFIAGDGFATTDCQNEIKFGSTPCTVTSSGASKITCKVDTSVDTQPFSDGTLSLRVGNTGYATSDASITLLPHISGVYPTSGSVYGGTKVTITGHGFKYMTGFNLGADTRGIVFKNYSKVVFKTGGTDGFDKSVVFKLFAGDQREFPCIPFDACKFTYTQSSTPKVTSVSPEQMSGPTVLTFIGNNFGKDIAKASVYLGISTCVVTNVSNSQITCDVSYLEGGDNYAKVHIDGKGDSKSDKKVFGKRNIDDVIPREGSIAGGTLIQITGNGFETGATSVTVDGKDCPVTQLRLSSITCRSPPGKAAWVPLRVVSGSKNFPPTSFKYTHEDTPSLTSISPISGEAGREITLKGDGFGSIVEVTINSSPCEQTSLTNTEIKCKAGSNPPGMYDVQVYVHNKGYAMASSPLQFSYVLSITSISPDKGSQCGGNSLTITGSGFVENKTAVSICGKECEITSMTSSRIVCETPPSSASSLCVVTITVYGKSWKASSKYTYDSASTPEIVKVEPSMGGTAGGTRITITGTGFSSTKTKNLVDIGGSPCVVSMVSNNEIVCVTEKRTPSSTGFRTNVVVENTDVGKTCKNDKTVYLYIDRWTSPFTWGAANASLPQKDDIVVIPSGQVVILDNATVTPVLKVLVIEGALIFEDPGEGQKGPTLKFVNCLVVKGGLLQIGTEASPYRGETIIELHGHQRTREIPVYGTKSLGIRHGTLELHGRPIEHTWVLLADTATSGQDKVSLQKPVDWKIGDMVVIPTTSHRRSQNETETAVIKAISVDKKTLTLDKHLEYTHLGVTRTYGKRTIELRGEVGLLTRSIKIMGAQHMDWSGEVIEACPEGFDTGEFATQTCFQGRFGKEVGSDQFGGHILFHSREKDTHEAVGHISHVELTYMGQAFRLGRYPIHFHLLGNAETSYVRGCAIHWTFNRAVNIHNSHNVLVEHNVGYNIMGGAMFLEDGIEMGNTFQYNLLVKVRDSSSLLNDDVTPAAFWVTHPNNTIQHNRVSGGSHFGFWYRLKAHPDGPSYDKDIWPQYVPLRVFWNNTVHSNGWFGLWIFEWYLPRESAAPSGPHVPAVFRDFVAWHNEKGAEFVNVGQVTFANFVVYCNARTGIEGKSAHEVRGKAIVVNSTIIACDVSEKQLDGPVEHGVILPVSEGQYVENTEFVNFKLDKSSAFAVTRIHCRCDSLCGGFNAWFRKISFVDSPKRGYFEWTHETILNDMDGTLADNSSPGSKILPCLKTLPSGKCKPISDYSIKVKSCLCKPSVKMTRFIVKVVTPKYCNYAPVTTTNSYGSDSSPWSPLRLSFVYMPGWMFNLLLGHENTLKWDRCSPSKITYSGLFSPIERKDWIIICQYVRMMPDYVKVLSSHSKNQNMSDAPLTYRDNKNGDWTYDANEKKFCYIISGKPDPWYTPEYPIFVMVDVVAYGCRYSNCQPPPDPRSLPPLRKRPSSAISFTDLEKMNGPFVDDNDLVIPKGKWVVRYPNEPLPKIKILRIEGNLELDDSGEHKLEAEDIVIFGRLVIGWEHNVFKNKVTIKTSGRNTDQLVEKRIISPEKLSRYRGPQLGNNVVVVFGGLDLHGIRPNPRYTHLAVTVAAGATVIQLKDEVDWKVGDEIAIASTSFRPAENERRVIAKIENKKTLTLDRALDFRHIGSSIALEGDIYFQAAEVAMLTRNIKFESHSTHSIGFGTRILVSSMGLDEDTYSGFARIKDTAFYQTGQYGYFENSDPRFTVAYLNPAKVDSIRPSYITGVSCVDTYSVCIGAFGADNLKISGSTIMGTVGGAIRVEGVNIVISNNLMMGDRWQGGFNGRYEESDLEFDAVIEAMATKNLRLRYNVVAGAERIGYHVRLEECDKNTTFEGNVAHSLMTGVAVFPFSNLFATCIKLSNFFVYRAFDYGVYFQLASSLVVQNLVLAENGGGLFTLVYHPESVTGCGSMIVNVSKSTLYGTTSSYDCETDKPDLTIKTMQNSMQARAPGYFNSGLAAVGIIFPMFMSNRNKMPMMKWTDITNYPLVCGGMHLTDVTFKNFSDNVCADKKDVMITSNPDNDDFQFPIKTNKITCDKVNEKTKVKYDISNASMVTLWDCVDMICDGMKQLFINDQDGTFYTCGTSSPPPQGPVAVISKSEDEWDGNPSWGLGDYRIPKTMLTDAKSGAKLEAKDLFPNKGHYRGDNNECTFKTSWNAYQCVGINYAVAIIQSLDADTETRRISPVAIATGGYIDLLNGGQDQSLCSGYTCLKRISTFRALMAMNRVYDMYFSAVSPQNLRVGLLNPAETDTVVIKIYFSTPLRLDVYSGGIYIYPTNANARGTLESPTFDGQYVPKFDMPSGSNWFDRVTNLLHILVRGRESVVIRTKEVVTVSLDLPQIAVDDFFGKNLVNNLATFLGVPAHKIRIVKIVREDSRLKRSTGSVAVEIEIGDPPSDKVAINETAPDAMSYGSLVNASAALISAVQLGKIDEALKTTVLSVGVVEPLPKPSDPLWNEMVENEDENLQIVVQIPSSMHVLVQPVGVQEGSPLSTQPSLQVSDNKGAVVKVLGSNLSPWMLTARLRANSGSDFRARLLGTTTIPYRNGWFNFTDLFISHSGSGYIIDFTISSPADAIGKFSANSMTVSVAEQQLKVGILPGQGNITVNNPATITVEIQDLLSGNKHHNIAWKGHRWMAIASLSSPYVYNGGTITGITKVPVNPDTSQAVFNDITFTSAARYYVTFSVHSTPKKYSLSVESAAIDVSSTQCADTVVEVKKTITMRFDADFTKVTGKYVTAMVMNHIKKKNCDIIISNSVVTEGSVVVTFAMSGSKVSVNSAITNLANDIKAGLKLSYGSMTFDAQPYLKVDRSFYSELTGVTSSGLTTHATLRPNKPYPRGDRTPGLQEIFGGATGGVVFTFVMSGSSVSVSSAITNLENDIRAGLKLNYGPMTLDTQQYLKVNGSFRSGLTGVTSSGLTTQAGLAEQRTSPSSTTTTDAQLQTVPSTTPDSKQVPSTRSPTVTAPLSTLEVPSSKNTNDGVISLCAERSKEKTGDGSSSLQIPIAAVVVCALVGVGLIVTIVILVILLKKKNAVKVGGNRILTQPSSLSTQHATPVDRQNEAVKRVTDD